MGLLDKLWDETLAGPTPDSGLGKLRKFNSFSAKSAAVPPPMVVSPAPNGTDDSPLLPISRSIAIPQRNLSVAVGAPPDPSSPSGSSLPSSPSSPSTPCGNFKRLTRRRSTSAAVPNTQSKSPTGYDWIVLSALDR